MVQTGAFIVLSRLPSERCGFSFSLASRDFTKRRQLYEVDDLMQERVGDVTFEPSVVGARLAEELGEARLG